MVRNRIYLGVALVAAGALGYCLHPSEKADKNSVTDMSAKDKETHDEYQELLARREALEEQMQQPEITEDTRHELMDEMREIDHQMRTLGESERKVLLNEVAQAIGMQGDAATELVETVSDVFEATESGGPPGPPPGDAQP